MRIEIDRPKCSGHGRCNAVAAEVYPLDDLGYTAAADGEVAVGLEDAARAGAMNCPEQAIIIIE